MFPSYRFRPEHPDLISNALAIGKKLRNFPKLKDINNIQEEAASLYLHKHMDACIFYSSICIEKILNMDSRLNKYKEKEKINWININLSSFKEAYKRKLPIDELLDESELDMLNKKQDRDKNPIFIIRRNKVLHGDISGYVDKRVLNKDQKEVIPFSKFKTDAGIPVIIDFNEIALDQLKKMQQFLIKYEPEKN
jgi:hypothetical protein